MITKDLLETIFFKPIKNGANKLFIIAGYASPNMASWLIKELQEKKLRPIEISLLVGMTPYDGLSETVHEGFKELHARKSEEMSSFSCSYLSDNPPVHSNVYIWMKNDCPYCAYCGSGGFMQGSFLSSRMEVFENCDPKGALEYYEEIEARTIYCNNEEVADNIKITSKHEILDNDSHTVVCIAGEGVEKIELSLLSSRGDTGKRSGLNWGQRDNRNRNEAYIRLPSNVANRNFFPLQKQHFLAKTDDNYTLTLCVEQQNNKALTTPLSNAQLGEYFRHRLGLPNGEFITKEHLVNYGRTSVTFYKIDEEEFYMDFSSQK